MRKLNTEDVEQAAASAVIYLTTKHGSPEKAMDVVDAAIAGCRPVLLKTDAATIFLAAWTILGNTIDQLERMEHAKRTATPRKRPGPIPRHARG